MAKKLIMPKLGMSMTEGELVEWLRDDGEHVSKGDLVVVVMSDKTTYEVEAPTDGIVRHVAESDDRYSVGEIIGFILEPGEEMPTVEDLEPEETSIRASTSKPEESQEDALSTERDFVPAAPAARRLAQQLGIELSHVEGTGPDGLITEEDVESFQERSHDIRVSPVAKRTAEAEGVDLAEVEPTGRGGRIVKDDVLRAMHPEDAEAERTPYSGIRKRVAQRMVESLRSTAQLTLTTKVDVSALVKARAPLSERWGRKISYTDLVVKAVATALVKHPILGGRLEEDEIVLPTAINIGVAVALEQGLIVPVVRNVDQLTVPEISQRIAKLVERARDGSLELDEVSGGIFTVTNLGMYGIDAFTPIINPPEAGILGVGRITPEAVLLERGIDNRWMMNLSLTIDHRIVDGAPGALFLQTLARLLETPVLIFTEGSDDTAGPT
jgi:pyruvate dehydrogenase E2 component (dihydrolipoamide acetyltransferase)